MINQVSIDAVNASCYRDQFVKPLYDSYGWSRIPQTVLRLLTGQGGDQLPDDTFAGLSSNNFDRVVLLFVDGFGWSLFERFADSYPFLKRFITDGIVSKSTSMFPSTTAAHTTTLYTQKRPIESGIFEWQQYEPLVDKIIFPLLFSDAYGSRDTLLKRDHLQPGQLFPTRTTYHAYQNAAGGPIKSYNFQSAEYARSVFSTHMLRGGTIHGFKTIAEALSNLTETLILETHKKAFYTLYIDTIDGIMHRNGPDSRQTAAEVDTIMTQLDRLLHQSLSKRAQNTFVLLVADHGQIGIAPDITIYLDHFAATLLPWLRTTAAGAPIIPGGSPRDCFLYIKPEALDDAHTFLAKMLDDTALVIKTDDLVRDGLFGPGDPGKAFRDRVGNLVILPYANKTVWWHGAAAPRRELLGLHGGLSPAEMETPILALPYL